MEQLSKSCQTQYYCFIFLRSIQITRFLVDRFWPAMLHPSSSSPRGCVSCCRGPPVPETSQRPFVPVGRLILGLGRSEKPISGFAEPKGSLGVLEWRVLTWVATWFIMIHLILTVCTYIYIYIHKVWLLVWWECWYLLMQVEMWGVLHTCVCLCAYTWWMLDAHDTRGWYAYRICRFFDGNRLFKEIWNRNIYEN